MIGPLDWLEGKEGTYRRPMRDIVCTTPSALVVFALLFFAFFIFSLL